MSPWITGLVIAIVAVGAILAFIMTPRGRRAALGAAPMGAYLRAREKGASAEDAIFDSLQVLRYREPWAGLSDVDLHAAASVLAKLNNPKLFTAVVVEVEESRSLDSIRNRDRLEQFVRGANAS